MIASVIAVLEPSISLEEMLREIAQVPNIEVGKTVFGARRVPITIDSPSPNALESTTELLKRCRGVALVDVVFVHFEEDASLRVISQELGTHRDE